MINKIRLALSIIFGKSIIVYYKPTKTVLAMINGNVDILEEQIDYKLGKKVRDNNGQIRYMGD